MIDIESLDTNPDCVILTIGAVLFNPEGDGIIDKLELRPTIEDQTALGRTINEDTLRWWGEQSEEAQEEALGDRDRVSFQDCMETLYKWCWRYNAGCAWSNGASFDLVVMESAWRQLGQNIPPWQFWKIRDTRTAYAIAGVKLKDGGHSTSHKAVEDAERQAIVLQTACKKILAAGLNLP